MSRIMPCKILDICAQQEDVIVENSSNDGTSMDPTRTFMACVLHTGHNYFHPRHSPPNGLFSGSALPTLRSLDRSISIDAVEPGIFQS
jgi:hypothetical protein